MDKKILIIDDEDQDRKAMIMALQKAGYANIICAENAADGLKMAKSIKPDIIVLDVVLKNADGFDLCKKIKSIKGMEAKTIIMITGHLDAVNAEKARHSGADELIVKVPSFDNISPTIKYLNK